VEGGEGGKRDDTIAIQAEGPLGVCNRFYTPENVFTPIPRDRLLSPPVTRQGITSEDRRISHSLGLILRIMATETDKILQRWCKIGRAAGCRTVPHVTVARRTANRRRSKPTSIGPRVGTGSTGICTQDAKSNRSGLRVRLGRPLHWNNLSGRAQQRRRRRPFDRKSE